MENKHLLNSIKVLLFINIQRSHKKAKRKAIQADITEAPTARVRRSQVSYFELKKHSLFCAKVCEPINSKHTDRWDKVVQCEKRGINIVVIETMSAIERLLSVVMVSMI